MESSASNNLGEEEQTHAKKQSMTTINILVEYGIFTKGPMMGCFSGGDSTSELRVQAKGVTCRSWDVTLQ